MVSEYYRGGSDIEKTKRRFELAGENTRGIGKLRFKDDDEMNIFGFSDDKIEDWKHYTAQEFEDDMIYSIAQ